MNFLINGNAAGSLTGRVVFVLAWITPFLMLGSRGLPPVILVAVAALLLIEGREPLRSRLTRTAGNVLSVPVWWATAALLAFALLSVLWTPLPERAAAHALQMVGTATLAAFAIATAQKTEEWRHGEFLAVCILATSVLLAIDISYDGLPRATLMLPTDPYLLNRSAVAVALFLPLVTAILVVERRYLLCIALWIVAAAGIFVSISSSAQLAILIVGAVLCAAWAFPVLVHRIITFGMIFLVLAMPLVAKAANWLIPPKVHEAVGYGSLTLRGEIWRAHAQLIGERFFFGFGLEAGHAARRLPETIDLPVDELRFFNYSHPHNAPLQVWFELGLVGALLLAVLIAAIAHSIAQLPRSQVPYATAAFAGVFTVSCVSHGAWQAWYWALVALIALGFRAVPHLQKARLG